MFSTLANMDDNKEYLKTNKAGESPRSTLRSYHASSVTRMNFYKLLIFSTCHDVA